MTGRRWAACAVVFLAGILGAAPYARAQSANVLQVAVESAFVRTLPDPEAPPAASVFANESLRAVGRNADGTWLQVQRPLAQSPLGWFDRRLAVYTFDIADLPLTDGVTGVTGGVPVTETGFTLLTISNDTPLHAGPSRDSAVLALLPAGLALPVLDRTPNQQWVQVNVRGVIGWLPVFLIRTEANLDEIPVNPQYANDPALAALTVVTREQQLAQADRALDAIAPLDALAADVASYWQAMLNGETVECAPRPAPMADFVATSEDIRQLPEIRVQLRLLNRAVADLNAALEATQDCGILSVSQITEAHAQALNARVLFRIARNQIQAVRDGL
jgi:hypothetical protein